MASKEKNTKVKSSKKRKMNWWKVVLIILAVVLVLASIVGYIFSHYFNLSNFRSDSSLLIGDGQGTDYKSNDEELGDLIESTGLSSEDEEELRNAAKAAENISVKSDSDVYNLLLVGVDRRDTSWAGNSDSMILLSINNNTKKIRMVSFMRDLYAEIDGHGVRKLNAACAYGGQSLLCETITKNYKVSIDNYASVDFNQMISIVDAIGGVTLEMSAAEVRVANGYIRDMCNTRGVSASSHLISQTQGGIIGCDGYQAVGYARIRFVGNSDYQRTERQRTVLTKMMEKIKSMSITELNSFAETVLPYITHNIDAGTMIKLLASVPSVMKYDISQSRVPYDDMFTVKGEILMPDMAATIEKLQKEIYE